MTKIYPLIVLISMGSIFGRAGLDDLEDINFPLNSSIVVDGFQGLDLLATVMAKHPDLDLEVTGHTDSLGSADYNKRLSVRRAEAVKTYLVGKGVRESQIKTSGVGIDRTHDNATREGRFQNRHASLDLYETVGGVRSKVSYIRLIELFCGDLSSPQLEKLSANNENLMQKLTELEKQHQAMRDDLNKRLGDMEQSMSRWQSEHDKKTAQLATNLELGRYSGVSVAVGADDDNDFTGQARGLYFRSFGDSFAVQAQGDFSFYDAQKEGQADLAFVFKNGGFRAAAAGSYKWVSLDGFEAARLGQGAFIADWLFGVGKIGVFGTFPFADGDVIASAPGPTSAFTTETYVNVPSQFGLDFGVSIGNRIDLSGNVSSLEGETDADIGAQLKLDVLIKDYLSWYIDLEMNESLLINGDDSNRYMTGLRFGSWAKARYNVTDEITPVNIPKVRYELLTRTMRTGNTAPVANAGTSRTGVAAGNVTLDGSASFDPDGDALTFKWIQTSGPTVQLQSSEQATASFNGTAGNSYAFQLTVRDSFGETGSDVVSIAMEAAPIPEPSIVSFQAVPPVIDLGQLSNLTWSTRDAAEVQITGIGIVPPAGTLLVSPEATTEYTLTASGPGGSASASVTLTVNQPPPPPDPPMPEIDFFSAVPDTIIRGEFTTLSWSTRFANSVSISGLGMVGAAGSLILSPTDTTTYELTATNDEGSVTSSVTVTVNEPEPPPPPPPPNRDPVAHAGADLNLKLPGMVTLDGSASFDPDGDELTMQWVQVSGRPVTLSGADTANPTFFAEMGSYTFRLLVDDGNGGTASDEVRVFVVVFKADNQ